MVGTIIGPGSSKVTMSCRAKLFVPVFVLRASAAKTKTIQHVVLALGLAFELELEFSEHRTAGLVSSEDDIIKYINPSELVSLL
jgi:hypothetical protein